MGEAGDAASSVGVEDVPEEMPQGFAVTVKGASMLLRVGLMECVFESNWLGVQKAARWLGAPNQRGSRNRVIEGLWADLGAGETLVRSASCRVFHRRFVGNRRS